MKGLEIAFTKTAKVALTADEWELYTIIPGAEDVATQINRKIEKILNSAR